VRGWPSPVEVRFHEGLFRLVFFEALQPCCKAGASVSALLRAIGKKRGGVDKVPWPWYAGLYPPS
jgi:hypothetical protein